MKKSMVHKVLLASTLAIAPFATLEGALSQPALAQAQSEEKTIVTAADGATFTVDGYNVPRDNGSLIQYTPDWGYVTDTKPGGMEIALTETNELGKYKVIAEPTSEGNSEIPENGILLYANPKNSGAVSFLKEHFHKGDTITVDVPLQTSAQRSYTKLDPQAPYQFPGGRGPDELIVYTPAYGKETTGTNMYGYEIIVQNGVVTGLGGGNSKIPADGMVLSGHGVASDWLQSNSVIGARVEVKDGTVTLIKDATTYLYQAEQAIRTAQNQMEKSYKEFVTAPFNEAKEALTQANQLIAEGRGIAETNPKLAVAKAKQATRYAQTAYYRTMPSEKAENRGTWYRPVETNMNQVRATLDRMEKGGFNAIYMETLFAGYTIYPSKVAEKYGVAKQNPVFKGFDVLKAFTEEGKKRGISVHAWVDGFMTGSGAEGGGPILRAHPEWAAVEREDVGAGKPMPDSSSGYFWLDITNPQVQEYITEIFRETVNQYGLAGLDLDYMRFPHKADYTKSYNFSSYSRAAFKSLHGADPYDLTPTKDPDLWKTWSNWIEDTENKYMDDLYKIVKKDNPQTVVSATPEPGAEAEKIGQWSKHVDVVIPQAYGTDKPSITKTVQDHKNLLDEGILVFVGVYPMYRHSSAFETVHQVVAANDITGGTNVFAFGQASPPSIDALHEGPWREKAVSPGEHPLKAIKTSFKGIKVNVKETYVERGGMSSSAAKGLTKRLDAVANRMNSKLDWSQYHQVFLQLNEMKAFVAEETSKGSIDPIIKDRLTVQITKAHEWLSYSETKKIK